METVKAKVGWGETLPDGEGIGLASLIHVGGGARVYKSDGCGTMIKMDDFGKVDVFTGATDMGQGSDTVVAQIVAEELGSGSGRYSCHSQRHRCLPLGCRGPCQSDHLYRRQCGPGCVP